MLPDIRPEGPVSVGGTAGDLLSSVWQKDHLNPVSNRSEICQKFVNYREELQKSWISDIFGYFTSGGTPQFRSLQVFIG